MVGGRHGRRRAHGVITLCVRDNEKVVSPSAIFVLPSPFNAPPFRPSLSATDNTTTTVRRPSHRQGRRHRTAPPRPRPCTSVIVYPGPVCRRVSLYHRRFIRRKKKKEKINTAVQHYYVYIVTAAAAVVAIALLHTSHFSRSCISIFRVFAAQIPRFVPVLRPATTHNAIVARKQRTGKSTTTSEQTIDNRRVKQSSSSRQHYSVVVRRRYHIRRSLSNRNVRP